MRLFLAIQLPEDVRTHIVGLQDELRAVVPNVSWVPPQNLHVTLKFLGELPDEIVPRICDVLNSADLGPGFQLAANGVTHFPPRGPVNVVVVTFAGDVDRAVSLSNLIEQTCEKTGMARERRAFTPHATIGRAKGQITHLDMRKGRVEKLTRSVSGPAFTVGAFTLVQSNLLPSGPSYSVNATFALRS